MPLNQGYVYRELLGKSPGKDALSYFTDKYRHSTPEAWAARFARGEVFIDGEQARGSEALRAGQQLRWHRPPWEEPHAPLHFAVIHDDADLLAVSKPSGLPTVPSGGFLQNTLLNLVQTRWPQAAPLHRLGRGTSGLVLFSRHARARAAVLRDWREGRVEKYYRALGDGWAAQAQYEVTAPIGLVSHPRLGEVYAASERGKAAHSTAQVLERRAGHTLFEVEIHTGRPDQIRIHLAFIGHPLVGDSLFAVGGRPRPDSPGLPGEGGYRLHSHRLVLRHPGTGKRLALNAAPPLELMTSGEAEGP